MHSKMGLMRDLEHLKVDKSGTLIVHSSFKSIGEVEGGPDTVLDALAEYMKEGLLVLPTHTWAFMKENPTFDVLRSPSCVGILTELFRKRPGVYRSWHPTHSVAAWGKDAKTFVSGDEKCDTPCAKGSAWGRLLDRKATIMLVGVDLTKNTFIHGIEEWLDIPGRISDKPKELTVITPIGNEIAALVRGHTSGVWSDFFAKVEGILEEWGAMYKGVFGNAEVRISDTVRTTELLTVMLNKNPQLFSNDEPVDPELLKTCEVMFKKKGWQSHA